MRRFYFYSLTLFISFLLATAQPLSRASELLFFDDKAFANVYKAASYLTDPICTAHRLYRQVLVVEARYPDASALEKSFRKALLLGGAFVCAFFSPAPTLCGMGLRSLGVTLQPRPFLYHKGAMEEKVYANGSITLLSWNVCCPAGGYCITDGGVKPWPSRTEKLVSAISEQDADVLCLYEIFDIQMALDLIKKLKNSYSHFYFNMGAHILGPPSGLFVASKIKVFDPEFIPFDDEELDGRAKFCKKGIFAFDVQAKSNHFVRIFSTHLQHSEIPNEPTPYEQQARRKEMQKILDKMQLVQNKVLVLTGDLNMDERETCSWQHLFDKGTLKGRDFTWGGDFFCATLMEKNTSPPLNLDHSMVMRGTGAAITTSFVETGFDGKEFREEALSDHKGLLSRISLSH